MLRSRCLWRGASLITSILRRIVEGRVEFLYALGALLTRDYPTKIGVHRLHPSTSPFDPGYDPATVESHLGQSSHLMSSLKISMACWLVAGERRARAWCIATVTGGGPFEIAVAQGELPAYLDLCADIGVSGIECGEGFTDLPVGAEDIVRMACERVLEVRSSWERNAGAFTSDVVGELIEQGQRWLDDGATQLVIKARERGASVSSTKRGS
jgi:phosphosulfolactate synthase